jgi:transcription initiation factor TFIID subunit 10
MASSSQPLPSTSENPPAPAGAGGGGDTDPANALNPRYIWNEDISTFVKSLDNYSPTLPTEVSNYYLSKTGVSVQDERVLKLVSLATDKFMADIIFDAKQFSVLRQKSQRKDLKRKAQESADTLEFQDLVRSLKMRGISIRRPNGFIPGEIV